MPNKPATPQASSATPMAHSKRHSHSDVIIIGAGIIGLSIAWQLRRRSDLSIQILERAPGLGHGSTGASSAVLRHRYSHESMLTLARDGIACYRNWSAFTGLAQPTAQFNNDGVLWLGANADWAISEARRLSMAGVRATAMTADELAHRFPNLSACSLCPDTETGASHACNHAAHGLFEADSGWIDPMLAAEDLRLACQRSGIHFRPNSEVKTLTQDGGRISGVVTASGEHIYAPIVINAAGPWCMPLYSALGLDIGWDIKPVRIQVLYLDVPREITQGLPVTADLVGGIYFRRQNQGQQLIVSSVLEQDEREIVDRPADLVRHVDDDFTQTKLHVLHHRLPGLPYRGAVKGYCGLYSTNRVDVHPVLGETAVQGLWAANGFSGHGFKLAPMIGALVARDITGTGMHDDSDVPLSTFGLHRSPFKLDDKSVLA